MGSLNVMIKSIIETIHPKGGSGLIESIAVLIILLTCAYCWTHGIKLPDDLERILIMVGTWLFGQNYGRLSERKKGKNE